jgi:hypothetical protein
LIETLTIGGYAVTVEPLEVIEKGHYPAVRVHPAAELVQYIRAAHRDFKHSIAFIDNQTTEEEGTVLHIEFTEPELPPENRISLVRLLIEKAVGLKRGRDKRQLVQGTLVVAGNSKYSTAHKLPRRRSDKDRYRR